MYGQMGNFQYFGFSLAHWPLKLWHFGKFCHWPCFVHLNYVLCMAKWEISYFFLSVWLIGHQSHSILGNFTVGPAPYTKIVSYVWSSAKFLLFPHWFGTLAVNARAFSEISLIPHQNLPFV